MIKPNRKEVKCPDCNRWTEGSASHCEHCGGIIDYKIKDSIERGIIANKEEERRKKAETAFDKLLIKFGQSSNPFYRGIFHFLNIVWAVYMALVAFVIWFTAIFSG